MLIKEIILSSIDVICSLSLFINASLFIPQIIKLYKSKDSREVSLITFIGFNLIQFFVMLHAYIVKDYLLVYGFLLSLFTCGSVTTLIIVYRLKSNIMRNEFHLM